MKSTSIAVAPGDTLDQIVAKAALVCPTPQQLAYQEMEFTGFIHFGPNTFSGREWGTGQEDPAIFNPTQLDARQWAREFKAAGMKMMVLVAKHHDGFCMWPSPYSKHTVRESPWKRDLLKEVSEACKAEGIRLGFYLSPADLNAPTYGNTRGYNEYYMSQMREILTQYGRIDQVWWDGANPKGKDMIYWRDRWIKMVRELAPEAVIFGCGPDVRWVGNESGIARETEWSVVPLPVAPEKDEWKDRTGADLGSREKLKDAKWLHWYPAEADVSIRPGWFWRESENDKVKNLKQLVDIYFASIGRNAVFLLNVPPDTRGLLHENDVKSLRAIGKWIKATFDRDLLANADSVDRRPLDGRKDTYWPGIGQPVWECRLKNPVEADVVSLQEMITLGQRVEKFAVEGWVDGAWKPLGSGTTIGYKRLLRFPRQKVGGIRVKILESRLMPTLMSAGLFLQAPVD